MIEVMYLKGDGGSENGQQFESLQEFYDWIPGFIDKHRDELEADFERVYGRKPTTVYDYLRKCCADRVQVLGATAIEWNTEVVELVSGKADTSQ